MRLSETLNYLDSELEKVAQADAEETKEAMSIRDEAIALGKVLADRDLGVK